MLICRQNEKKFRRFDEWNSRKILKKGVSDLEKAILERKIGKKGLKIFSHNISIFSHNIFDRFCAK